MISIFIFMQEIILYNIVESSVFGDKVLHTKHLPLTFANLLFSVLFITVVH